MQKRDKEKWKKEKKKNDSRNKRWTKRSEEG